VIYTDVKTDLFLLLSTMMTTQLDYGTIILKRESIFDLYIYVK